MLVARFSPCPRNIHKVSQQITRALCFAAQQKCTPQRRNALAVHSRNPGSRNSFIGRFPGAFSRRPFYHEGIPETRRPSGQSGHPARAAAAAGVNVARISFFSRGPFRTSSLNPTLSLARPAPSVTYDAKVASGQKKPSGVGSLATLRLFNRKVSYCRER